MALLNYHRGYSCRFVQYNHKQRGSKNINVYILENLNNYKYYVLNLEFFTNQSPDFGNHIKLLRGEGLKLKICSSPFWS